MSEYINIVRGIGRIEGRLDEFQKLFDEIHKLSERVSKIEHSLSWLKGAWAVLAAVCALLFKGAYAK